MPTPRLEPLDLWQEALSGRDKRRYAFWIKKNFSSREAQWAVQAIIAIRSDTAKWLVRMRRNEIGFWMRRLNMTRPRAIRESQRNLRAKNIVDNFHPYNIFRIASP